MSKRDRKIEGKEGDQSCSSQKALQITIVGQRGTQALCCRVMDSVSATAPHHNRALVSKGWNNMCILEIENSCEKTMLQR